MDAKITRTRVIIPQRRPDQLSRPRVLKRLFDLNKHKLIIVVAPPGYGKTSLLIDFARKVEHPLCWYAIDSLDQNPSRFFSHLVGSIAQIQPGFGRECHLALQEQLANNGALVDLVPTIVNELYDHVADNLTLVLDDFHLVQENEEIQAFLNAFIQQVEDGCQVVLSSRRLIRLPDLPLMVARSLVGGISMEDLCFQTDEIQGLIAQNFGETIDEDRALELVDKTEGWVTGLLLSTQLNQHNSLGSGSLQRATGIDLYDYLAQQVFLQQKLDIQEFLLRTSLLDEFNEDFCEQIFVPETYPAGTDWQGIMDAVVANNLFILPVGDGKPWFRYHNLFREFLSRRVHKERPQEVNQILDRLAEHYIQAQSWEQAYQVRQQQDNVELLADMIEEAVPSLMRSWQLPLCEQWVTKLPEEVVNARPILLAVKGYVNASTGGLSDGFTLLSDATEKLSQMPPSLDYVTALMWRAVVQRMLGEFDDSIGDADWALGVLAQLDDRTGAPDSKTKSKTVVGSGASGSMPSLDVADARRLQALYAELHCSKGIVYCLSGNTYEGIQQLKEAVKIYDGLGESVRGVLVLTDLATANMNAGYYEEARIYFYKALERISSHSRQSPRAQILNNLGVLYHLTGDYVKASSLLHQAVESAHQLKNSYLQVLSLASLGDLWKDLADAEAANECYREAESLMEDGATPYLSLHIQTSRAQLACMEQEWSVAFDCLDLAGRTILNNREQPGWYVYKSAMGQFHLASGNNKQAAAIFQDALTGWTKLGQRIEVAQTCLLLSGAHFRLGDTSAILEPLEQALTIVEELLIWQPLIVKGQLVKDMLEYVVNASEYAANDTVMHFVEELLERIKNFEKNLDSIRLQLVTADDKPDESTENTGSDYDLTIRTLGRIEIVYQGRQIQHWQGKSHMSRDLFFCLIAHKDGLTKEEIGALFWPDAAPAELKVRFKNAIYRVRKAIATDVLVYHEERYCLNPDIELYCDATAFEEAIASARRASTSLHEKKAYQRALALYTGDYLVEIEAMWAWLERERLAQLHVDASLRLAEIHLDYGETSESVQLCQRLLADEPCLEEAHRIIMQTHAAAGNRVALVRQYELCEQALHNEFGAQPSEQTRSLFIALTS